MVSRWFLGGWISEFNPLKVELTFGLDSLDTTSVACCCKWPCQDDFALVAQVFHSVAKSAQSHPARNRRCSYSSLTMLSRSSRGLESTHCSPLEPVFCQHWTIPCPSPWCKNPSEPTTRPCAMTLTLGRYIYRRCPGFQKTRSMARGWPGCNVEFRGGSPFCWGIISF